MKKIILIILVTTGLNAADLFTELTFGYQAVETTKIYGEEPLENVVGGESTRIELLVGKQYIRRGYSSGSDLGSSIFGYGWVNDEKKNNEIGIGLGMKIESHSDDLCVYIAGKSGIGYQDVKGERFELDTNANKMSYVFGVPAQHGDFVGIYTDDTYTVDIELELGANWKLTDALSAVVSVSYLAQWYSFSYRVVGGGSTDLSGYGQDSYVARVGLNYRF